MPIPWQDLRLGVRGLRKQPLSALITSFTLALGLGLCTTVFSLLYGVFVRTHPAAEPGRLLLIHRSNPEQQIERTSVSIHDFYDWREQQRSFVGLAGFGSGTVNLAGTELPDRYDGGFVSANTFELLGVRPIFGTPSSG